MDTTENQTNQAYLAPGTTITAPIQPFKFYYWDTNYTPFKFTQWIDLDSPEKKHRSQIFETVETKIKEAQAGVNAKIEEKLSSCVDTEIVELEAKLEALKSEIKTKKAVSAKKRMDRILSLNNQIAKAEAELATL